MPDPGNFEDQTRTVYPGVRGVWGGGGAEGGDSSGYNAPYTLGNANIGKWRSCYAQLVKLTM